MVNRELKTLNLQRNFTWQESTACISLALPIVVNQKKRTSEIQDWRFTIDDSNSAIVIASFNKKLPIRVRHKLLK